MRYFYFLIFSFLISTPLCAQGNLPFEYMGIEYNGTIYHDGDTITICGDGLGQEYAFNAEYLPIGLGGNDYAVSSIPFTDVYPLEMENWLFPDENGNGLLDPGEVIDDTFSSTFTLPFSFCYFGSEFSSLKVGSNGRVTFDLSLIDDGWSFEPDELLPTLVNPFSGNTIYGVYQDTNPADSQMDFDPNDGDGVSNITYGIFGEAPFRSFVVSYAQLPLFGSDCDELNVSSPLMQTYQIVLHEGTNVIDIIVWNRTSCPEWNDGLGIIGIQNVDGTIAYVPPGRNTGTWETSYEAWRFTPNGGEIGSANTITWNVGDTYGGSDTTLVTTLDESTTITLNNKYFLSCINDFATASVDVYVEFITITLQEEGDIYICPGESTTLHAVEEYDSYNWYQDGNLIPDENGQTLVVMEPGAYAVEYSSEDCTTISNEVNVYFTDAIPVTNYVADICDIGEIGSEVVDLSTYYGSMVSNPAAYSIEVYPTEADAEAQTNEIANTNAYSVVTGSNVVYVRFASSEFCYSIGSLTINLGDEIALNPVMVESCESGSVQYDLMNFNSEISTDASLTFTYYSTEADAGSGTNSISNMYNASLGSNLVYVRAENAAGCFNVTTITFNLLALPVLAAVEISGCASEYDGVFDLISVQTQHSSDTSISYSYYNSMADAESGQNAIPENDAMNFPIQNGTVVYVKGENPSGCFSITSISFDIFVEPALTSQVDGLNVTLTASNGNEPFEYSLDGTNWTSENSFSDLTPGDYTGYVRTADGCMASTTFTIIPNDIDFIPSIITPNGDGINDTWVINGIQYFPGSVVKLFDRYGKLIVNEQTTNSDEVWNATYLDDKLTSGTYWYIINLSDGRVFKGYLVVRNRNSKDQL